VTRPDAHARYEELAAGHALSALEPEDEQDFLAHLAGCAPCERALAEHRSTLTHLAYAPEPATPPASLIEGIRAGVLASGRDATFPEPAAPEPVDLDVHRRRRDASRLRRTGSWVGIAAAAALIVSLGAWNASLQRDRDAQAELTGQLARAVSPLRDASTDTVPLTGESGEVVAVALVRGEEMTLVVDGLPVNDAATTYVLWGESRYGDKRAVGAFDVTSDDVNVLDGMRLKDSVADVTRFLVTREQGDSAPPIPTLPVLAAGTV
jgi:hypothetical protein